MIKKNFGIKNTKKQIYEEEMEIANEISADPFSEIPMAAIYPTMKEKLEKSYTEMKKEEKNK